MDATWRCASATIAATSSPPGRLTVALSLDDVRVGVAQGTQAHERVVVIAGLPPQGRWPAALVIADMKTPEGTDDH
jgi:hypothetical protein